jgi:chitinase
MTGESGDASGASNVVTPVSSGEGSGSPADSGSASGSTVGTSGTSAGRSGTANGSGAPTSEGGLAESGATGSSLDAATGGAETGAAVPSEAAAPGKTDYAPYYEIGADTGAFTSLVDLKQKAGLSEVTLAFVLSGGNCSTDSTISDDLPDIKAFVAAGGHVKASFGGADGTYVESDCSDANSLATAISNFVDATGITDLDFDIEQGPALTKAVNTMRGQALKMVQDSRNIQIAFTLEADPAPNGGLNSQGISVVTQAVAAGVRVSHVNMMVMDFGDMPSGTPLAPIAIGSLTDGNAQLMKIIPGLTTEQAWAMIGATPDIGNNDDNEVFSLADAQALATFAMTNKLGLIAFWSIQRDQVCGHGECSGYDKANFDYNSIFKTVAQ